LGARTGGGGKNEAGTFDVHFVAAIGMGDRFGDADHGGEMKDVGNASEGIVEGGRLEDRSMEEAAGKALKVGFLTGGKIIEDGNGSVRLEAMDEMAADEARASCNQKFHSGAKFAEKRALEKTRENRLRQGQGSGKV